MTPLVVNGKRKSNHLSRYCPNKPRRPNEKNRETPATTGGSTIDSVHRARTALRPGNLTVASNHASGTPKNRASAVAAREHLIDSHSAVRTDGWLSTSPACPQGTRHSSPMNGKAKNAIATSAMT